MVPRPRIELGTPGFSVREENLCIKILTYLVAIGQAAKQLLSSHQNDHVPTSARFSALSGKF
jgi:hypothetical protein